LRWAFVCEGSDEVDAARIVIWVVGMATWGVESELRAAVASWAALSTRAGFFFAWLATESVGAVSKIAKRFTPKLTGWAFSCLKGGGDAPLGVASSRVALAVAGAVGRAGCSAALSDRTTVPQGRHTRRRCAGCVVGERAGGHVLMEPS
jgi:hypothetical protein